MGDCVNTIGDVSSAERVGLYRNRRGAETNREGN